MSMRDHGRLVRDYLAAIEAGATGEALARFYTPDVEQEEFPNRLNPTGRRSDLAAMLAAADRGRQVLRKQAYEVHTVISEGDVVAVEVTWTGTLAVPLGSLAPGDDMRARFCMVLELEQGRIRRQRNYDCFDAF